MYVLMARKSICVLSIFSISSLRRPSIFGRHDRTSSIRYLMIFPNCDKGNTLRPPHSLDIAHFGFHLYLSGHCTYLVDIHSGEESTSRNLKLLVIDPYLSIYLFLTGFNFSKYVFHYLFHRHTVSIQVSAAIFNPISRSIQFQFWYKLSP
jgi:hypothetical protein